MFHNIPAAMSQRMAQLERMDQADRASDLPTLERLRQVPRETGMFIALMAALAPAGAHIEIGTSAGYSTMWLSLACRAKGCRIRTFEVLDAKAQLARETFRQAGIEDVVEFVKADAREYLASLRDISFCFLDAEKNVYDECYELVVPRMVKGGLLVADNAINHRPALEAMIQRALSDQRVDAMVVPVENGELVCRKI